MGKLFVLATIGVIIGLLLLFGCTSTQDINEQKNETAPHPQQNTSNNTTNTSVENNETNETLDGTFFEMNEQKCKSGGGNWNSCGSACRGAPSETACIAVCMQYCECGGIAGFECPEGFYCTDYLPSKETPDAMGICKLKNTDYNLTTETTNATSLGGNKTETEKNSDALAIGGYVIVLDDVVFKNNVECAALQMYNKTTMKSIHKALACPGVDTYWVAPNGHKYRIVVTEAAAGMTKNEIWAKIFIYG